MRVLAMTCANRPDYLRQALASIRETRGIRDYVFMPVVETFNQEVVDIMRDLAWPGVYDPEFLRNDFGMANGRGCSRATYRALERGFATGAQFVITTEDDVLLAPDTLEYFEWAADRYRDDPTIFTVRAWNKQYCSPSDYWKTGRSASYTPQIWGTWIDRWEEMAPRWDFQEVSGGFDFRLQEIRGDRFEIYPHLSRAQNIGVQGIHTGGAIDINWYYRELHNAHWAGNLNLDARPFHD